MTAVLNIVFAAIAGVSILAALYYGARAVVRRGQPTESAYNVGRLQARRSVQIDLVRALAAVLVALIFLGAFGLTPRPVEPLVLPTEPAMVEETDLLAEPTSTQTLSPTNLPAPEQATPTEVQSEPSAAPSLPQPSATPLAPTNSPEPALETAVVSSGVGVWLRASPGTAGEQLEWLLDGTVLTLLDGQEAADDFLWRQVQTESGLIGWVATDFILISE